jgi:outer membrane protein OmpA-like peptidoglycan-associated protein
MIKIILTIQLLFSVLLFAQAERDELFNEVEILLNNAKLNNADLLCAVPYSKGVEEYTSAKKLFRDGESPVEIREKLESSIAYITKVNNNIEKKQELFASTIGIRNSAIQSGANKNAKYFWELGENKFKDVLNDYDDNEINSIPRNKKVIEEYYTTAKLYSNKANSLINSESIREASNNKANLLAPISYEKAEDNLFKTLDIISYGKKLSEINKSITDTELLFDMASVKASKYLAEYSTVIAVRKDAKIIEADKYVRELWDEAEEGLRESGKAFEEEDFDEAAELAKESEDKYLMAKQISLKDYFLSDAKNEINLALDEGAELHAPKTLKKSQDYFAEVTSAIESDFYSVPKIKHLAKESFKLAIKARKITEISKRMEPGNEPWEDIILAKEGSLLNDNTEVENISTDNKSDYSGLIEKLEQNVNSELDISEQKGVLVLLLKNVQFSTMSSKLNDKSKKSIDKVIAELQDENFSEATIVCYTDNIGTKSANKAISKKRADAILKYLIKKDNSHKYYMEGRGESNPIVSNSTAEGRKKNRRVEIEIK